MAEPGPETPSDSPLTLEDVMSSPAHLRLMTPTLARGDPAFPFELPLLDAETHRPSGERVRLGEFTGVQPVALVFGSYTCPPFCRQLGELEELHDRHGDGPGVRLVSDTVSDSTLRRVT